jgi:hypothetical protein
LKWHQAEHSDPHCSENTFCASLEMQEKFVVAAVAVVAELEWALEALGG